MATFFLCIIYSAFISLGLPDSLFGAAWPVMHLDMGAPLEGAGLLSMITAGGTILSSLASSRLLHRFGTGRVTLASVALTAFALLGYAVVPGYVWMLLLAVPLGLGAGAVDTGLNSFVAQHYSARHMSWLHCFWGLGATLGPVVLSGFLKAPLGWKNGYLTVAGAQLVLTALLAATLPLWDRYENRAALRAQAARARQKSGGGALRLPGAGATLAAFFFYCSIESTAGLWGASFLVAARGMTAQAAARGVSLYYFGITLGRFFSGLAAARLSSSALIRLGQAVSAAGGILLLLPLPFGASTAALWLIGLGFAPVYPCLIHETPHRFGAEASQSLIGLQMACAYVGSTFAPPLFGLAAARFGTGLLPACLLLGMAGMALCSECAAHITARRNRNRP